MSNPLTALSARWRKDAKLEYHAAIMEGSDAEGSLIAAQHHQAKAETLDACADDLDRLIAAQPSEPKMPLVTHITHGNGRLSYWLEGHDETISFSTTTDAIKAFELLRRIERALALAAQPSGWQPISSAPKGSWLEGPNHTTDPNYVEPPRLWLLLDDGEPCVGYADAYYAEGGQGYDGGSYWVEKFSGERVNPTHWMLPLPASPERAGHP